VRGESLGLAAEILGGDLGSAEYPLASSLRSSKHVVSWAFRDVRATRLQHSIQRVNMKQLLPLLPAK
jgi:hypothetical protein